MSGESSRSIEYSQHIGLVTRERDHRAAFSGEKEIETLTELGRREERRERRLE